MCLATQNVKAGMCFIRRAEVCVVTKTTKEAPIHANGKRVIKKYPNRRLYDTLTSSYITLMQVKQMVMEQVDVMVLDAKNHMDLTRSVLLQIILEEETEGVPMFSQHLLEGMIRFYGHALQNHMGHYLERNVQLFTEMQKKLSDKSLINKPELWVQLLTPLLQGGSGSLAEESNKMFLQMQEAMQQQLKVQTDQMLSVMGVKPKEK
jgi:polyhydroxyalkanoate synthesis repressor PhaR